MKCSVCEKDMVKAFNAIRTLIPEKDNYQSPVVIDVYVCSCGHIEFSLSDQALKTIKKYQ